MRTKTTKTVVLFHPTLDDKLELKLFATAFRPFSKGKRIHLLSAAGLLAQERKKANSRMYIPTMPGIYTIHVTTKGPWYNRRFKALIKDGLN